MNWQIGIKSCELYTNAKMTSSYKLLFRAKIVTLLQACRPPLIFSHCIFDSSFANCLLCREFLLYNTYYSLDTAMKVLCEHNLIPLLLDLALVGLILTAVLMVFWSQFFLLKQFSTMLFGLCGAEYLFHVPLLCVCHAMLIVLFKSSWYSLCQ